MNRLFCIFFLVTLFSYGIASFCGAQNSSPPPQQAAASRGNSVEQKVDPTRPPVETATLADVTPGVTTTEELTTHIYWGEPLGETIVNDQVVWLYSMPPLNHIEVVIKGDIVRSIAIQLDPPFTREDVRNALSEELLQSKPVRIPDENGTITGEIYPEKGVMFLFAPQTEEQGYLVDRIAIEPISAEPFVLRAEAILYSQPADAKMDLRDAIRLNSDDAKAYGLLAQIELMEGHVESAMLYTEKAIQLDEQRPSHHLTFVQALTQMNRIEEAKQYLLETIRICDNFPHERAKALVMLGDLYRTSRRPDLKLAHDCHLEAIDLAKALRNHKNPTVRLTAKDVLVDAHLAMAKVIAWGRYENHDKAIKQWIDTAKVLARDSDLVKTRRYSREYPFKIAACSLATLVAAPDNQHIDLYVEEVREAGNALIKSTDDPVFQAKYHWETGISLYDAVQILQLRKQYSLALKYGEWAAQYMKAEVSGRNNDTDLYLLGRLYFRLGAIHALIYHNHRAAIEWYDLAVPIFERLLPKIEAEALELFGKMLVSMGVSYWETDQKNVAVKLTERGLRQIQRGVRDRVIDKTELLIPYTNLAMMFRALGDHEQADNYIRLAESVNAGEGKIR